MSDPLTGWLTLAKAPKDTTYGSNTKWDTLARANDIRTLSTSVNLPDFTFDNTISNYLTFCRFAQYNYTASQPFTILGLRTAIFNATEAPPFRGLFGNEGLFGMMVRFRVGNKVTRYQLVPGEADLPIYPFYSGQVISPQFCIEFYAWPGNSPIYNLIGGNSLITSILNVPSSYGSVAPSLEPINGLITNFQLPLGNALPYVFPDSGPWNSN